MSGPTLTEFLLARIAEDEVTIRQAKCGECLSYLDDAMVDRVLADAKAKRAIVEARIRSDKSADESEWAMGYSDGNYDALHILATVYADHPDYRDEWKP